MSQLYLNDPNRVGGSSAINLADDIGIMGPASAAKIALWAADMNVMFGELYSMLNYRIGANAPFSTTIPLSATTYMQPQSVVGPLAFIVGANPAANAECRFRLTADGTHIPTFPGFTLEGASAWVNTAGAVNLLVFQYAGSAGYVAISQDGATTAAPVTRPGVASIGLVHGINPTLTIATNGAALNLAAAPPCSAFTLATTQGAIISSVTVSANAITLTLAGTVAIGDTVTLSYAPVALNGTQSIHGGRARDASGNYLAAITAASVIVS